MCVAFFIFYLFLVPQKQIMRLHDSFISLEFAHSGPSSDPVSCQRLLANSRQPLDFSLFHGFDFPDFTFPRRPFIDFTIENFSSAEQARVDLGQA